MKDLATISSDLFNKIRSRFSDIKIGDDQGALTTDPAVARFFDVNYKVEGKELGRVNIKIDEKAITVIYNDSMTDGQAESVKETWFAFLKDIRQFARKNLLTFDTRDITKSNLEKRDYKYLAQETGEPKMSESKLFGTSKTSYQDMGEARLIVKHSQPVNYNVPAGRTQHIESIYIESSNGERFRYPHKHLNGARAMARHIANGGTAYDTIGSHISGLSEELSKLRQFKNYTQRSGVMAEALSDVSGCVLERIDVIKTEIANLQKQNYYESFKEGFQPTESMEVPEDTVNSWIDALTIKTFNEELKAVFPYIYKLVSEKKDDGLTYEDLVKEEDECGDCGNNPCTCEEEEVKEDSMFQEFEDQLEAVSTFDYDFPVVDEAETDEEDPPFDPPYKKAGDNKDEFGNIIKDKNMSKHLAKKGMRQAMPKEVVEFIASMYDKESGTFPRGEEGVKIAVEKQFGEQAGQFAHFVVEKLSAKNQMASEEQTLETEVEAQPDQSQTELERIRSLSGF